MRRTPSSRAASSTLSVPSMLTAVVVSGSWTERGTDGSAPWWKTTSAPRTAACTRSYERRSPSTSWTSFSRPARFVRLPVEKLSSTRTSSPRSSSARTTFDPMKPPPPVTSVFIAGAFSIAAAPAAASPRRRQVAACSGIPATIPRDAHSPAIVSSAQTLTRPAPAPHGGGARVAARHASVRPAAPTRSSSASPITPASASIWM